MKNVFQNLYFVRTKTNKTKTVTFKSLVRFLCLKKCSYVKAAFAFDTKYL